MFKFLTRTIHQSYFVVALAIGIIAGTILALVFRINFFASPLWLAAAVVALIVAYLRPRTALIIIAVIAGMILSFFRATNELQGEDYIRQFYDQTITVTGTIDGDPNHDEANTKFKIKNLRFGESGEREAAGSLYVTTTLNEELHRSDIVTLEGKLLNGFGTYAGYLYKPTIAKIARPDPGDPILNTRDWFADRITSQLPEPENNLGLSYLLGMKTGLPDDLNENLRTVGLVHIVVASGAHLSILVEIARRIFGKISRFSGLLLSVIFILFFMALVGFTPSIMRAGIMSILAILAWYVGRKFAPWRIILLVAAATLLIDPMFIINLGWLLSFASFAGIMILGPKLSQFFYGDRQPKFIASVILTTISATLMTLPIILYYFGTVSLISVIANLFILPTLPIAMGLTFFTGALANIPLINTAVSFLTEKLLNFHISTVNFFAEAKSFLIEIDPYQPQVFFIYLLIFTPLIVGLIRQKMLKSKQVKYQIKPGVFMSGHSKWATTKRQKAVVDAKRGALFTKIGNQIAIAARSGTDPTMNPSLAMVLDKARHANMPKANIERAIARATDKSAAALIEETYEAYGPGGVGIVIEVATDNKNRTMPEVRHTLDKNGGRMADPGSVMFQFERKGVIVISEKGEEALMAALEAGAEDASEEDDGIEIITAASDLMKVNNALKEAGLTVTSAELQYVPSSYVPVEGDAEEKLNKLLEAIDDLDDVTNVYTNAE
ncbi:YebC/PmpR family DNA-binding transcriptional regulator [Candidatus Saccharibacteria bacterium]|nr:YebC/PmpR family DNA-binding transcriptional regulator [Candidatus Saccharibacteria bacterium]